MIQEFHDGLLSGAIVLPAREIPEDENYRNNVAAEAACISAEEQAATDAQSAQQDKEKAEVQEPEEMD